MIGQAPSCTCRLDSSWLKPSWMNARVAFPDCETPRITDQRIEPATGLALPKSSCTAFSKKEFRSRNAANPTPSTYGSFTGYTSS